MSVRRCARCHERAHVLLASGVVVCWPCWNRAVRETDGKVEGQTIRRPGR